MELILIISTILGGLAAIWFLWDKIKPIIALIKVKFGRSINPLSLADDEIMFFNSLRKPLLSSNYIPTNAREEEMCKSLVNAGVLHKSGEFYSLTAAGRSIACA